MKEEKIEKKEGKREEEEVERKEVNVAIWENTGKKGNLKKIIILIRLMILIPTIKIQNTIQL